MREEAQNSKCHQISTELHTLCPCEIHQTGLSETPSRNQCEQRPPGDALCFWLRDTTENLPFFLFFHFCSNVPGHRQILLVDLL